MGLEKHCNSILSDNMLFSMFRTEPKGSPVHCPFGKPPYDFTYSKGKGVCSTPTSRVDSCSDDSHLQLKNSACTDIDHAQESGKEQGANEMRSNMCASSHSRQDVLIADPINTLSISKVEFSHSGHVIFVSFDLEKTQTK